MLHRVKVSELKDFSNIYIQYLDEKILTEIENILDGI
jgi:hypothetical protein